MNISNIKELDVANGDGIRTSIFVSGCRLHCKGCFNYETWDFNYGTEFTKETLCRILHLLDNPNIKGLSILGGEPMDVDNQKEVANIIREVKKYYPTKDIWLWTGYTISELLQGNVYTKDTEFILNNVDVTIDGPFILEQKNLNLKWRGSENQIVTDNHDHHIIYCR